MKSRIGTLVLEGERGPLALEGDEGLGATLDYALSFDVHVSGGPRPAQMGAGILNKVARSGSGLETAVLHYWQT